LKFYVGGVLDSTDVNFFHRKSETHWASIQKCKASHGAQNRVKAFGFKNRFAAKRLGFKNQRLALAA